MASSSSSSKTNAAPFSKYKLIFLGDQAVGKTSIVTRFMYDTFDTSYQPTIGIDFVTKTMHLDDKAIRFQLWDTAGQERFHSLIPGYIRDSSVAVIVYDITRSHSFQNTTKWLEDVRAERGDDMVICLVGNKTDLQEHRQVSVEQGENQAKTFNVLFTETSAKAGLNIKLLFRKIAAALPSLDPPPEKESSTFTVDLSIQEPAKNEWRCFC